MTLTKCSCGQCQTTKNATEVHFTKDPVFGKVIWLTCGSCGSTMILRPATIKKRRAEAMKGAA